MSGVAWGRIILYIFDGMHNLQSGNIHKLSRALFALSHISKLHKYVFKVSYLIKT